jgi:FixJ family two-component response regulator
VSRSVLILDDDDDLRETLAETLQAMCGVEPIMVPDVAAMIEHGDQALGCTVALVDVNLGVGQPSGIDAYRWLVEHSFRGRIVFLTGHARVQTMVEEAVRAGTAQVIQKPASLRTLCALIESAPI